jgi:hypothetical protein
MEKQKKPAVFLVKKPDAPKPKAKPKEKPKGNKFVGTLDEITFLYE